MPDFLPVQTTALGCERARHAREGSLTLQICDDCGAAQYPSREICRNCLSGALSWSQVAGAGTVVSIGIVHASLHAEIRERAPWRICSVLLDAGPIVIAHVADATTVPGDAVAVRDLQVADGQCVLVAENQPEQSKHGGRE